MNESTGVRIISKEKTPAEAKADVLKSIDEQGIVVGDTVTIVESGVERPITGRFGQRQSPTKRGEGIMVGGRTYEYIRIVSIKKGAK